MIDRILGDVFGVLSYSFWSTVLQCGAPLPIHTLNCSEWWPVFNWFCVFIDCLSSHFMYVQCLRYLCLSSVIYQFFSSRLQVTVTLICKSYTILTIITILPPFCPMW